MLTEQTIFNDVAKHLFAQGHQATTRGPHPEDYTVCVYRAPNGDKCAFGALIADAAYEEGMEGVGSTSLIAENSHLHHFAPFATLISDLQVAHDTYNEEDGVWTTMGLRERLAKVATKHSLDTSLLDTLSIGGQPYAI